MMTYNVSFPNLGLNFTVNTICYNIGVFTIHWYGIIVAIGFLAALLYVSINCRRFNIDVDVLHDIIIFSSAFAIIGARLYYVVFYPGDYYLKNIHKIFSVNEGGIAIYGAIIFGLLGVVFMCRLKKQNLLPILDLLSIGLAIGQSIGRWGNFVNQEAFGTHTSVIWAMSSENTLGQTVHPCFLYESIGCFLVFFLLNIYSRSKFYRASGNVFYMYGILYGLLRASIEEIRTDSLLIANIKVSQLLSIIIIFLFLTLFRLNLCNKKVK